MQDSVWGVKGEGALWQEAEDQSGSGTPRVEGWLGQPGQGAGMPAGASPRQGPRDAAVAPKGLYPGTKSTSDTDPSASETGPMQKGSPTFPCKQT